MHKNFKLVNCFVSIKESILLQSLVDKKLTKPYVKDHFDGVIRNYRESTFSEIDPAYGGDNVEFVMSQRIISKIRNEIRKTTNTSELFQIPHILDLDKDGYIDAHIDHIEASGSIIATLSLLSPTVLIFKHKTRDEKFKLLIPPNSLYIQWDELRYDYSHEIPSQSSPDNYIDLERVDRGRRISIIQRTFKNPYHQSY